MWKNRGGERLFFLNEFSRCAPSLMLRKCGGVGGSGEKRMGFGCHGAAQDGGGGGGGSAKDPPSVFRAKGEV